MAPVLDIIIVNWNAGSMLHQCLASIDAATRSHIDLKRVVVVDNASTERPLQSVDTAGLPTVVIRNEQNRGFAAACNQGAAGSQAAYLLFLNPDTRLLPNSLIKPLAFLDQPQNREIGIVGVQLLDASGQVSRTCARFPTPGRFLSKMLGLDRALPDVFQGHFMTEWDHRSSREVDQVMGAFFMVRRSMFDELGGFDEQFFVYFEEVDLSARARARGWSTFYLSDAQAYHRGGGVSEQIKAVRLFYSLRSRILYAYKHFGWWSATTLMVGTLFVEPLARLALTSARGSLREFGATLKAYALLFADMLAILRTALRPLVGVVRIPVKKHF